MDSDKTKFIIRQAMVNSGLSESDADIVAERTQHNTDAVKRFEALEAKLARAENGVKWLGGLLLANYSTNIIDWLTR